MFRHLLAIVALVCLPVLAVATPLPAPSGAVILTVSGAIGAKNTDEGAQFDQAMLARIGEAEFSTATVWTDGVHHFKGVRLKALLAALGVSSGTLNMYAVNDYMVDVPVSDATEDGPILAYEQDGQQMNLRDRGPLWLIYPYDSDAEYRTDVIYSRSIWQLDRIEVLP